MADKIVSERHGKRLKHIRREHWVGGILGPRKVGTSYEVKPLPAELRDESVDSKHNQSHVEWVRNVSRQLGLPRKYLPVTDRDLWSKGYCPFCEGKKNRQACENFVSTVIYKIEDYLDMCCPECGMWVDGYSRVLIPDSNPFCSNAKEIPSSLDSEMKVKAEPCGCIMDERKYFPQANVPENDDPEKRLSNLESE